METSQRLGERDGEVGAGRWEVRRKENKAAGSGGSRGGKEEGRPDGSGS